MLDNTPLAGVLRGPVGIVATSPAAVQEVIGLLAVDAIGVSHVAGLPPRRGGVLPAAKRLLAGLQALQDDRDTQVIALVSGALAPADETRLLAAVGGSAKPVIVCLLGANQRAIWRSGAIPAVRLDEVAMRAAAWARGWDQALVSSRLLEQDDELAAKADELRTDIEPLRTRLRAVFDDPIFCEEARLMLAGLGVRADWDPATCVQVDPTAWQAALVKALADPGAALVVVDILVDAGSSLDRVGAFLSALGSPSPVGHRSGLCVIAHLCSADAARLAHEQSRLLQTRVALAPGNAAAARLAAMVFLAHSA